MCLYVVYVYVYLCLHTYAILKLKYLHYPLSDSDAVAVACLDEFIATNEKIHPDVGSSLTLTEHTQTSHSYL